MVYQTAIISHMQHAQGQAYGVYNDKSWLLSVKSCAKDMQHGLAVTGVLLTCQHLLPKCQACQAKVTFAEGWR